MGSLIIFTVIAATTIPINSVYSKSLPRNDIRDQILQTVKDLLLHEESNKNGQDHDNRLNDDDDNDNQYGSLQNHLQHLIRPSSKRDHHRHRPDEILHHESSDNKLSPQLLEQLLQGGSHKQRHYNSNTKKQRLQPNDLLASLSLNEEKNDQVLNSFSNDEDDKGVDLGDLSDYSKVYVILNSEALEKSKNKKKLNRFLSNLLSASSQNQDRVSKKDKYYKGFVLKGLEARRSKRDSKEMSAEDYKPKRLRAERGGGGGGGRTAIPYIRHRGDIYERGN